MLGHKTHGSETKDFVTHDRVRFKFIWFSFHGGNRKMGPGGYCAHSGFASQPRDPKLRIPQYFIRNMYANLPNLSLGEEIIFIILCTAKKSVLS